MALPDDSPKPVSLLYALSGDRDILDALHSADDDTRHGIEAEMKTRVRAGGKDTDRTTGNLVWAEFIHTTSRPVDGVSDPHCHARLHAKRYQHPPDHKSGSRPLTASKS